MATRKNTDPLDKYLPDEATADAVMNGPIEFPSRADPKLVARLQELNRISSEDVLAPAPPSEAMYAEVEIRQMNQGDRGEPKVKIALPPAPSERPTEPGLRRFEGEPEVPGVVKGPPRPGVQRLSLRSAVLAMLAVFVPVLLVILLMGRTTGGGERTGATSAATVTPTVVPIVATATMSAPSAPSAQTAVPSPVSPPSGAPSAPPAASAAPSAVPAPSAPPSSTSRPVAPSPSGTAAKHPPLRGQEEPHDAPPTPQGSAAPTAVAPPPPAPPTPPATPPTAPVPPSTTAPSVPPKASATSTIPPFLD